MARSRPTARSARASLVSAEDGAKPAGPSPRRGTIRPMDVAIVLVIILVLVLLWRGPQTLPRLGEALGQAVRGARRAAEEPEPDGDDEKKRTSGDQQDR